MQSGKKLHWQKNLLAKMKKTKLLVAGRESVSEPLVTDNQHNQMMHYYRQQEELKKLEEANNDRQLLSEWSEPQEKFQGLR